MRRALALAVLVLSGLFPPALAAPCDPCDRSVHGVAPALLADGDMDPATIEGLRIYQRTAATSWRLVGQIPCIWYLDEAKIMRYTCQPYNRLGWPTERASVRLFQGETSDWRMTAYYGDAESAPSNIAMVCTPCTWDVLAETYQTALARCPCPTP